MTQETFLISGTSRGLGLALAKHYVEHGHRVFGCSRNASDFRHEFYRHIVADVGSDAEVRNLFAKIREDGHSIDVVINNAGISQSRLAVLTSAEEAERLLRTNFLGSFLILRESIKHMKRRKFGRIINMSSINVPLSSVGGSVYNATKAGVENLSHTLSRELVGDDITINTIGLSVVADTGMAAQVDKRALEKKLASLTKPDVIDVAQIVHAIDYFISPLARNVTNQIIYFGGIR